MKYSIYEFRADFPNEDSCLEWLVNKLYPQGITCKKCKITTTHYKDRGRKSYSCTKCGNHFHPTSGTIFEKSSTPLSVWFEAIYRMTSTKCGVSAKEMERTLGVTYKTAWRMMHKIRELMALDFQLSGEVEIDETYFRAKPWRTTRPLAYNGRAATVLAMVERNGRARAFHISTNGKPTMLPIIRKHVIKDSLVYTDGLPAYKDLQEDYRHDIVIHSQGEYVRENVYTNTIENVFSHIKRGIQGVYRMVTPEYLQSYLNEFCFRYSYRKTNIFWALMNQIMI